MMRSCKSKMYNIIHLIVIIAIHLNINCVICFVFKMQTFARLHDISHKVNNKQNECINESVTEYPSKHLRSAPSTEFLSTNRFNTSHDEMSKFRSDICINIPQQCDSSNKYKYDLIKNGDTTDQDDIVRSQYSSLPYPAVRKNDLLGEKNYYADDSLRNIPHTMYPPIILENINHFLYNGANDFMNGFRTLIPGGGTDGGSSFMAEQLNHTNSETVYVDFSTTSMSIAQARILMRRSSKIVWATEWIESIPRLGLGKFDFAHCTGVLHHLKSPQIGLNILKDIQIRTGGAGLMVYGKYGRTGVYQIQDLLRIINKHEKTMDEELGNAKHILKILPEYHWFHHIPITDHKTMGNIGIYDLLLHKRDVSYSIPDLYEWLGRSNLYLIDFSSPHIRIGLSLKLKIREKLFHKKLTKISIGKQRSIVELMAGEYIKQEFYASKLEKAEASLEISNNVIYAYGSPMGIRNTISNQRNYLQLRNETYIYANLQYAITSIDESSDNSKSFFKRGNEQESIFAWPSSEFNNFAIISLTKRPIKPNSLLGLVSSFKKTFNSSLAVEVLKQSFKEFYAYIKDTGLLLVKRKSVGTFPKTCCINQFTINGIRF